MSEPAGQLEQKRSRLRTLLLGPHSLAFMPALTLGGYWLGGEVALVITALALPAIFAFVGIFEIPGAQGAALDHQTGFPFRKAAVQAGDRFLARGHENSGLTAAFAIGLDDYSDLEKRLDRKALDSVLTTCGNRVLGILRTGDIVARLDGPSFGCVLVPGNRATLDSLLQIANRILRELEEPVIVDGARIFVSASVGLCSARVVPENSGEALLSAAEHALADAQAHGSGTIRAFAPDMQKRRQERHDLAGELSDAIENEQIRPWFQPQISLETGEISGVEVLARWEHPERGIVPPAQFLDAAEDLGLMERLGEKMLYQALGILRGWDSIGLNVPTLSMNFSGDELRNPMLVDRVRWELDRFGVAPSRLVIEVLETVMAQTSHDIIVRNIRAFTELGCSIDLDDFGTGHASITNIKRFSVSRIKIDRSFVTQLDTDAEQQNIVGAILTMANRLGLETLAEGVETPGRTRQAQEPGVRLHPRLWNRAPNAPFRSRRLGRGVSPPSGTSHRQRRSVRPTRFAALRTTRENGLTFTAADC